ncbi:MAG: acyl-CoA thioesterase [Burkholderiaceae bacterium]|nr:acyl-CoA thioesterase [Burkholderiaceae bacterium]
MTASAPSTTTNNNPRPVADGRDSYARFVPLSTRWMDNDAYGHLNNVVYLSLFDTAVNQYLIEAGALDLHQGAVIGLVVETHCNYFDSLAYPQRIEAGLRVHSQGRSSVRYEIGLFAEGAALCAARGHFVHVYVDRQNRRPVAQLPAAYLSALKGLTL